MKHWKELPKFTASFARNLILLENFHGKSLSKLNHQLLLVGTVSPMEDAEAMVVQSMPGSFVSAAFLTVFAFSENAAEGCSIGAEEKAIIQQFFGEIWYDEPGTGKHPVLDMLRRDNDFWVCSIPDRIEKIWGMKEDVTKPSDRIEHRTAQNFIRCMVQNMNEGILCVVRKVGDDWVIDPALQKAVAIYQALEADKIVPICLLPPLNELAVSEHGSYVGKNTFLPDFAFISVGSYIGSSVILDAAVSVGECCYIGEGSILGHDSMLIGSSDPELAPAIMGEGAYLGVASILHPGVVVGDRAVIDAGIQIFPNAPLLDDTSGNDTIFWGKIPDSAIVLQRDIDGGKSAAYIAGYRYPDELRDHPLEILREIKEKKLQKIA